MEMNVLSRPVGITKGELQGRFDILAAQKIDLQFNVIMGSHTRVIVDLEQVPVIASMGIRPLIMGAKTMKSKGGGMALLRPSDDVSMVLEEIGADTIIPVVAELQGAIDVVLG
jgi:anti-anti-sigma factor